MTCLPAVLPNPWLWGALGSFRYFTRKGCLVGGGFRLFIELAGERKQRIVERVFVRVVRIIAQDVLIGLVRLGFVVQGSQPFTHLQEQPQSLLRGGFQLQGVLV